MVKLLEYLAERVGHYSWLFALLTLACLLGFLEYGERFGFDVGLMLVVIMLWSGGLATVCYIFRRSDAEEKKALSAPQGSPYTRAPAWLQTYHKIFWTTWFGVLLLITLFSIWRAIN